MNSNNEYTPGYAIYENGSPTRVALFNFITDPSGASNYVATIAVGGSGANQTNASPAQVSVRYFSAPSVTTRGNLQWAGQVSHIDEPMENSNFGANRSADVWRCVRIGRYAARHTADGHYYMRH